MKSVLVLVLVAAACGGEPRPKRPYNKSDDLVVAFANAVAAHDAKAITAMFADAPVFGGMWFPDAACTQQFPTQHRLTTAQIPALATCLANLPLRPSERGHEQADIWVLDYEPGFEIEIEASSDKIFWIGYASRRATNDALPTISGRALARLRTDHTAPPNLPGFAESARALDLPFEFAWFKVCLDATGAVTGVHLRQVTSPDAASALGELTKQWTFAPFVAGGTAIPVCALTRVDATPPEKDHETLPLDVSPEGAGYVTLSSAAVKRIEGRKTIVPDDEDKRFLVQHFHGARLVAVLKACFDEAGKVEKLALIKSSGLPRYDRKLQSTILDEWHYAPKSASGVAFKACTGVTFIYTQR